MTSKKKKSKKKIKKGSWKKEELKEKQKKTRRYQRPIGKARGVFFKGDKKKVRKKRDEQREEKTRITPSPKKRMKF